MKIATQTPDEIILKDSAWGQAIFGLFSVVVGSVFVFMVSSDLSLSLNEKDPGQLLILLFLLFPAIGLWMLLSASWMTVDINKTRGQISLTRRGLLGAKNQVSNTSDVVRVELRKAWQRQNKSQVLMHQSVLVLKDTTEIPLDHQSSSPGVGINGVPVLFGTSSKEVSIGTQVAQFLNVPFQEIQPSTTPIEINLGGPGGIKL